MFTLSGFEPFKTTKGCQWPLNSLESLSITYYNIPEINEFLVKGGSSSRTMAPSIQVELLKKNISQIIDQPSNSSDLTQ